MPIKEDGITPSALAIDNNMLVFERFIQFTALKDLLGIIIIFGDNWCLRFNILFDVFGNIVANFESWESGLWGLGSKTVELETSFKSSTKEIHAANKYIISKIKCYFV